MAVSLYKVVLNKQGTSRKGTAPKVVLRKSKKVNIKKGSAHQ